MVLSYIPAMEMHGLQELLHNLGLDAKDIAVYETCLTLGPNPASVIAKQAEMNRSTTNHILQSLAKKGFINFYDKAHIRYFTATDPHDLLTMFEQKRAQFERQFLLFSHALKDLQQKQTSRKSRPRVTFFDGQEGLKRIYEDTLSAKNGISAYASIENLHRALPDFFPEYYRRRAEKKIPIRVIFPATPDCIERVRHDPEELRESRLIPKEYDFGMEINIYNDTVAFMSLAEGFGVLLISPAIAATMRKIYDLAWRQASLWSDAFKRSYGFTGDGGAGAAKSVAGSNGIASAGFSMVSS